METGRLYGVPVVFGGDSAQILPVVPPAAAPLLEVRYYKASSPVWMKLRVIRLTATEILCRGYKIYRIDTSCEE